MAGVDILLRFLQVLIYLTANLNLALERKAAESAGNPAK
jgi:hypothetical protein